MKATRRAVKIVQDEDTSEIIVGLCAFLWEDVVGMEDAAGSKFTYPRPRTWIWLTYAGFYVEGDLEQLFQEWQNYLSSFESTLFFSKH